MGAVLPSSIGIAGLGLIGGSLALAAAWQSVRRIGHDSNRRRSTTRSTPR